MHRDLLHFLIVVPCRRGEAANMRWEDVDIDSTTWAQPGALTKNGQSHRFYLSSLSMGILKRRYEEAGRPSVGLVFPAPRSGKAIDTFSGAKSSIDAVLANGFEWRLHDHRRSFVTALAEAGIHEAVLDGILNHKQSATRGGVLGVYQQAQRWPEQVAVMCQWDSLVVKALPNVA